MTKIKDYIIQNVIWKILLFVIAFPFLLEITGNIYIIIRGSLIAFTLIELHIEIVKYIAEKISKHVKGINKNEV